MRMGEITENVYEVSLRDASDEEMKEINESMGLALSIEEMRKMRDFFRSLGRDPTDIEIHAIAQGWSEHCSYKSSKRVLSKYIFGIKSPHVLLKHEDAGVVEFNEDYAYVFKIESHNHPSAVEPYGGAATGVGGIIRDVLNMGAKPIAIVDPLFFGPPDYRGALNAGVKHPLYLMKGVIAGIRDYGNRVGIPTIAGITYFDDGYINNILVNAGCLGIVRKDKIVRSSVDREGILLVMVGGRTGRDGIHGVNFASRILDEKSEEEKQAVQLGNPILKEPLIHLILEANEEGIIYGMKDLGGGGLSSVIGEMCYAGGVGAEIHLDRVILKEKNMAPWEIWVSESQERMLLGVEKKNIEKLIELCEKWDIEMSIIGKTKRGKNLEIYWKDRKILDLPLDFMTAGVEYERNYRKRKRRIMQEIPAEQNYRRVLLSLLSSPNIASKEWIIRQYDHEVQGRTVIKPMHGVIGYETHGDASVVKPLRDSWRGLAITTVANPHIAEIDPYLGALHTVDEAVRNLVAVNSHPHSFSDCLNFGNPENEVIMGEFVESCRGLGEGAKYLGIPFVSGNVSFYNEAFGVNIPPTAVLMAVGMVKDIRKCVTADFKGEGNAVYVVGETTEEMGGSEYYRLIGAKSTVVPQVNLELLKKRSGEILRAMERGLIRACHDVSHGGIGVALAEMCIGGNIGADVDLFSLPLMRDDFKLFSESPTRWICEVEKGKEEKFESIVNARKIGYVGGDRLKVRDGSRYLFNIHINILRERWKSLKGYPG